MMPRSRASGLGLRDAHRLLGVLLLLACGANAHAQDARERLGPKDAPANAAWAKKPHPLTGLLESRHSALRPELRGKHPRVYVTAEGLDVLRQRARTTHRELWRRTLDSVYAVRHSPPPAPAQERRVQNRVGVAIAEAALAYKIEGDPKYLAAAKRYMDAALSYPVWGYLYNKPDVDLAAGHLLYGMGWAYDLLYHDLTDAERRRYRDRIARQARKLAEYYQIKPGRTFSYSQNHVSIPMAGLAVAAYALYDEVPEAPQWAKLTRAIYDRVLATYSADGYYYEGLEYWIFATPWLFHYLDAHAHATGEDLYDLPGFRNMHRYVAHSMLPDGQNAFDFGDIFEGSLTRMRTGEDHLRTHPGGRFHTNYNMLYRLAARFRDPEAQGVAQWLREFNQVNMEDYWSLLWYDPGVPAAPMSQMQPWHYFPDHGVVFWRTDWTLAATAFAFKSGPPEGHKTTQLTKQFPDWHLATGHAHPDANSFIIYANGKYLTGDTGWTGLPMTAHHNTVLVNGRGQAREGEGHDVFQDVPYDRLNQIRIAEVQLGPNFAFVRGDAAAAYEPELGVKRFERRFLFTAPGRFLVWDDLETEKPSQFTTLLHADQQIKNTGAQQFAIDASGATLRATLLSPAELGSKVEPNEVIAPGAPGSVDQGERQQRGVRLAVTTLQPSTRARILMLLETDQDQDARTKSAPEGGSK